MAIYLNGYEGIKAGKKTIDITCPYKGEVLAQLPHPDAGDGKLVLDVAERGFTEWSAFPMSKRADILTKYANLLEANMEEIAMSECLNMGKIINECRGEMAGCVTLTRAYIEKAKHLQGHTIPAVEDGVEKDLMFTIREPLGILLCIVPFNYPPALYTYKVIAALLMGNSTIIKVPSSNPLPLLRMTELLVEAGVPASAVGMVYASQDFTTNEIIRSDRIHGITLTGSTRSGIEIWRNCADTLHKVFFELGGNDPMLIFEDADLDYACAELMISRMTNTGQICCASKRIIVHESIADALVKKLKAALDKLVRGNPEDNATQIGCLVTEKAANKVMEQIQHTIKQGAKCVYGNTVKNKTFVEPTILVGVTKDMDIAQDMEVFGPVIPIITFRTREEAIEIANNSIYGLEASIISGNLEKAINTATKIKAGSVVVNGGGAYRPFEMPFTGFKMSGVGCESVSTSLEEFSQQKCYIIKHVL